VVYTRPTTFFFVHHRCSAIDPHRATTTSFPRPVPQYTVEGRGDKAIAPTVSSPRICTRCIASATISARTHTTIGRHQRARARITRINCDGRDPSRNLTRLAHTLTIGTVDGRRPPLWLGVAYGGEDAQLHPCRLGNVLAFSTSPLQGSGLER